MTSLAITEKLDPSTSEQVTKTPEELEAERTKLQFAAVFNSCVEKARGGDGVSIAEYELTRRGSPAQIGFDLGEILSKTPSNRVSVITIYPRVEGENIKHIFYLNKVSDNQSLLTFFEVEHDGVSLQNAKLWQEINDGKGVKEKRMAIDTAGSFKDLHTDATHETWALTDPEACRTDLTVVPETVLEPVEMAVRHTSVEFERVERPYTAKKPNEVPDGLLGSVAFGLKHRGEKLKTAV